MTTPLQIFYSVLAILITWLLYRIWRRNRISATARTENGPVALTDGTGLPREARESRFEPLLKRRDDNTVPRLEPDQVPTSGTGDYVFGLLTPVLAALLPESAERRAIVKKELITAGYHQPHAWQNLAAVRYLGIMLPLFFIGLLIVLLPRQLEPAAVGLLLFLPAIGWAVPRLLVRNQARERLSEIEVGMPDMLDMLNMCVSQGMTIPDSLMRVSRELSPVYPALAQELNIMSDQAQIGSLEQALENFADRIDAPDVHSFTTLLIQTSRMGTSVSQALSDYSDNMRESLRQRADEKANTATFKLLFPTVACLMPAVFLFLLGPAIIQLSDFFNNGGVDNLSQNIQQVERLDNRER
jgi:tight adherence protein C